MTLTKRRHVTSRGYALRVDLRLASDGPVIAREPVAPDDLSDCRGELHLESCLRKGHPAAPLDQLDVRLTPEFEEEGNGDACNGFLLETTNPSGETVRRRFSIHALEHVAERASQRLLATGQLQSGQLYYYGVAAERGPVAALPSGQGPGLGGALFTVTRRNPPFAYLTMPLPPLLARAHPVGQVEGWFPVFYTHEAFRLAKRLSRRGAQLAKPVETGGVLIGPVCSCPETGEFFAIVADVLELRGADEGQFSLSYGDETWTALITIIRSMREQPATRAHRIVGQCHGHNFLPHDGEKRCEECDKRPVCSLSSVFVSKADRRWTRAVFAGQAYATCHIFGLSARGDEVHGLFGLRDGQLQRRGFHLIREVEQELREATGLEA